MNEINEMEQKGAKRERPVLFSGPMVRAILEGRKTQTRRVVKPEHLRGSEMPDDSALQTFSRDLDSWCPYGRVGDRLWVKETFCVTGKGNVAWRADGWAYSMADDGKWKPSIFMPRKFSRVTLEIVSVRVERLQEISEADAVAEGCEIGEPLAGEPESTSVNCTLSVCAVEAYRHLWESINGPGSWAKNPWVWVIEFRRVQA